MAKSLNQGATASLPLALLAAFTILTGCAVGVKSTPGMKLYSAGDVAKAIPMLEAEVLSGQATARYPLGLAYRDGSGVPKDLVKAEALLTGAAIGGDPRAVSAIKDMLETFNRCDQDRRLRSAWGGMVMYRNLVTGVVELNTATPGILRDMAAMYEAPCAGAPAQPEAAKSLRGLSGGPRYIWIYVPR